MKAYRWIEINEDDPPVFKGTEVLVQDVVSAVFFPEWVDEEERRGWIDAGISNEMAEEAIRAHNDIKHLYGSGVRPMNP